MPNDDQQLCQPGQPLPLWEARVKELVREVIREEGSTIPAHVRAENHEFVTRCRSELQAFLDERRRSRERWEKIRTTVIGGLIISAVGGIVSFMFWVGTLAMQTLAHPTTQTVIDNAHQIPPK